MNQFVTEQLIYVLRRVAAALCGGLIGCERQSKKKTAGTRTHVIIHELDTFLVEIVPFVQYEGNKKGDLIKYLNNHPDLTRYVVIDDMNMEECFPGHFVHTKQMGFFDEDSLRKSIRILECEDISI